MTGAVVGAALLTNMILLNSVRASDRGWQHLMGERDWEEKMAMLKEDRIERDKKLQQHFSTAVNNLDGKIEDLKGGLNKKIYIKNVAYFPCSAHCSGSPRSGWPDKGFKEKTELSWRRGWHQVGFLWHNDIHVIFGEIVKINLTCPPHLGRPDASGRFSTILTNFVF